MTRKGYDWSAFQNKTRKYRSLSFTQIPDEMLDEHLAFLSGAELKVLIYVARKTLGWRKKNWDGISLHQMIEGVKKRDGTQADHGTGLSKPTVLSALASLEEKGLLIRCRQQSERHGHEPTMYALNMEDLPPLDEDLGEESSPREARGSGFTKGGKGALPRGARGSNLPEARQSNFATQERTRQQTEESPSEIPPHIPQPAEDGEDEEPVFADPEDNDDGPIAPVIEEAAPRSPRVTDAEREVLEAWAGSMPEGSRRDPYTPARIKAAKTALKREPLVKCVLAVQGWRWDEWGRRPQNNDVDDCLRPANIDRFAEWEQGINRPRLEVLHPNGNGLVVLNGRPVNRTEANASRADELRARAAALRAQKASRGFEGRES